MTAKTNKRQSQLEKEQKDEAQAKGTVHAIRTLLGAYDQTKRPLCTSLSIKTKGDGFIMTLKGNSGEGPSVCFVMSDDPAKILRKAAAFHASGRLKWRIDEWEMSRLADNEEDW